MSNLTQNQQDIITQITNEFKKINDDYNVYEGGLIDLSRIVKELNEDKIRRSEIEVQNSINKRIFIENVNKDLKRINDDLVKYDLVAFIKWDSTIRIGILREFSKHGESGLNYYFDIQCCQNSETIYFNSQINNIQKTSSSYYYKYEGKQFNSLEDLIGTSNFTEHMRQLIVRQNPN